MLRLSHTWRSVVVSIAVISSLLIIGGFREGGLQDMSLMMIGYREHDVSVRLTKEDFRTLVNRAVRAGTTVNPCQAFLDDDFVVQGVDVLWHRLGTNGLLRFPSRPLGQQDNSSGFNFQFEPLNANFTIVKTSRPAISCTELGIDSLFGSGSATLRPAAEVVLRRDLDWIKSLKVGELVRIGLHGGDSLVGADGATTGLTTRRAQALHTFLAASYDLPDPGIMILDHGASEPKLVCPEDDGPAGALCKKINRRIEVSRYDPDVQ